jgi:predicted nucleic acid-binding protein
VNVAVDTSVLAYAEGVNGLQNRDAAVHLMQSLPPESTLIPVQALGELFSVLVRKAGWPRPKANAAVTSWGDAFPLIETSNDVLLSATDLAHVHQLGIWDAVMLSAAADARCRLFLSEDLQDGFTWRGVTVANPFAASRHPLLEAMVPSVPPPARRRAKRRG